VEVGEEKARITGSNSCPEFRSSHVERNPSVRRVVSSETGAGAWRELKGDDGEVERKRTDIYNGRLASVNFSGQGTRR
jgi:hypothetical protein